MTLERIVPDVIDTAPHEVAKVVYPSGAFADQGNVLTPFQVKDIPNVSWTSDDNCWYTLCMINPDAPNPKKPEFREWHHWLVGNIPACNILDAETLSAYVGSGPRKGTGFHRYVFLVYEQSKKLRFDERRLKDCSANHRKSFPFEDLHLNINLVIQLLQTSF